MCASVCMPPAAQEVDADPHGFPQQFDKRSRLFSSPGEGVDERRVRGRLESLSNTRPSAGKDRHSKVNTSKGPRDRRVRLSVTTAVQFYEVQDRLGYDQPSKAVEWLMRKAKAAIDELAHLPMPPCPTSVSPPAHAHHYSQQNWQPQPQPQAAASECGTPESVCGSKGDGGSGLSTTRMESRAKARQRARERAKGKVGAKPAPVASAARLLQEELMSMHEVEQECVRKVQPMLTIHDYDLWQGQEEDSHPGHGSRLQHTSPAMRTGQRLYPAAHSMCGRLGLAGLGMGQPELHVVPGLEKPPPSYESTAFWETCVRGPNPPLIMGPLQSTIPQATHVPAALRSLMKELHGNRSGDVV